ncbi:Zinc finger, CCHC-type superfamily [Sesbania bispinosa]|nr:Zinc finger, CCHC-type superfamily [Sesbania bispinosa]KAJ1383417.1 Zinc finger, CCHC-type superfamily [Sesbania bispinosa]
MSFDVNNSKSALGKNKFNKKERPKCAHCNMMGHTKDKCYKLVGYPPNYFNNRSAISVNQVDDTSENQESPPPTNLTPTQCQQLISLLINKMQNDSNIDVVATNVTGPQDFEEDWHC